MYVAILIFCALVSACSDKLPTCSYLPEAKMKQTVWGNCTFNGLRRVSRSLFSMKMSNKSHFSSKYFNFKNPNTIYLIVRTALHHTTAKVWKVSCFDKNNTSWMCRNELCSLTKKTIFKTFLDLMISCKYISFLQDFVNFQSFLIN
jgi:hypothetical protein